MLNGLWTSFELTHTQRIGITAPEFEARMVDSGPRLQVFPGYFLGRDCGFGADRVELVWVERGGHGIAFLFKRSNPHH